MSARTPLHDWHTAAGAQMVPFGGYEMPLQYSGIRQEHMAVRTAAGIFDLSHMGEVYVAGPRAVEAVDGLLANDVRRLSPGMAAYAVMCNPAGGIVDDVIAYRDAEDVMVVVNASCRAKDVAWIDEHCGPGAHLRDSSDTTALVAVQGPRAVEIVASVSADEIADMRAFRFVHTTVAGVPARVSRTGYTGEDGFELYVDSADAQRVWDALITAGRPHQMLPIGLGARDTLRLEAGLRLYGQDMDDSVDPFSCGLGWTVRLEGRDFIGADALRSLDAARPPRRFAGLGLTGRAIARHGHAVYARSPGRGGGSPPPEQVGEVTSGTFSFTLGRGIATAYIDVGLDEGTALEIDIRGVRSPAATLPLPFYKRPST